MRNVVRPRATPSPQESLGNWLTSLESNPYQVASITSLLYALIFVATLLLFVVFGAYIFASVSALDVVSQVYTRNPLLQIVPSWVIYLLDWHNLRFAIAPLAAIIAVLLAGMAYVQDIYALGEMKAASTYVLASMFGLSFPESGHRWRAPPDTSRYHQLCWMPLAGRVLS